MALSLRWGGLAGSLCRNGFRSVVRVARPYSQTSQKVRLMAQDEMNSFWLKNQKLGRPWSPHLTIYKPQLTSMLSLLHRGTGVAMTVIWTVAGWAALLYCQDYGDYSNFIASLERVPLGVALLTSVKFVIAWPVCYHIINGVRHLFWDYAVGFSIKTTYKSGWIVLGLSVVMALGLASYTYRLPPKKSQNAITE